jgi:hypothetical protein
MPSRKCRHSIDVRLVILCGFVFTLTSSVAATRAADSPLRVATFVADITPPVGEPLVGGFCKPVAKIEHPLLAKGIVLADGGGTYVLCSLDLCALCNGSFDRLRQAIAEAAGTVPRRVGLHEIQQHTAGIVDMDAQQLLDRQEKPPAISTAQYLDAAIRNTAAAVREAAGRLRAVTHVGAGQAAVDRVASSRRIRMPDGRIVARMSATRDPVLKDLPEGVIDPNVRSLVFFDGETPLACIHAYAMHPQSFYGDGRVSYDVPGIARERLEKETGVVQVYLPGCGGNVTMGKYNDGTPEARTALAERLYDAMARSVKGVKREPVAPIEWKVAELRLPLRGGEADAEARLQRTIASAAESPNARIKAAMNLAWIARVKANRPVEISCLRLGSVRILNLPGDTFVEYQLWAEQACPDKFVLVAGFGDFGMYYLCTDQAYVDQGGYEQSFTFVDPCEKLVKAAMAEVLGSEPSRPPKQPDSGR